MQCNATQSWSQNQSKYLAFYMAVHGSLWKTGQELTWTAVTTRSKVTKFQKGLSLSTLVQLSRSSEVTELLTSASCCCFWLKTWLTVSQSEKQSPLCLQANFVQVCPMSSRNPFFNLMWLPGSGLSLSCGKEKLTTLQPGRSLFCWQRAGSLTSLSKSGMKMYFRSEGHVLNWEEGSNIPHSKARNIFWASSDVEELLRGNVFSLRCKPASSHSTRSQLESGKLKLDMCYKSHLVVQQNPIEIPPL